MSKYSYIVDGRLKADKEILTHIANELAEANRLKRLELDMIACPNTNQVTEHQIKEDKA